MSIVVANKRLCLLLPVWLQDELAALDADADLPIEQLMAKYYGAAAAAELAAGSDSEPDVPAAAPPAKKPASAGKGPAAAGSKAEAAPKAADGSNTAAPESKAAAAASEDGEADGDEEEGAANPRLASLAADLEADDADDEYQVSELIEYE